MNNKQFDMELKPCVNKKNNIDLNSLSLDDQRKLRWKSDQGVLMLAGINL